MLNHEWIRKTEAFLKEKFDNATEFEQEDLPYRMEHTYRVANIGREIAAKEGFDETCMVIACLLHDISYYEAFGETASGLRGKNTGNAPPRSPVRFWRNWAFRKTVSMRSVTASPSMSTGRPIRPASIRRLPCQSATPTASTILMPIVFMKRCTGTHSWKNRMRSSWSTPKSGFPGCMN